MVKVFFPTCLLHVDVRYCFLNMSTPPMSNASFMSFIECRYMPTSILVLSIILVLVVVYMELQKPSSSCRSSLKCTVSSLHCFHFFPSRKSTELDWWRMSDNTKWGQHFVPVFAFDIFCHLIGAFYSYTSFVVFSWYTLPVGYRHLADCTIVATSFLISPIHNEVHHKPSWLPVPVTKCLKVFHLCRLLLMKPFLVLTWTTSPSSPKLAVACPCSSSALSSSCTSLWGNDNKTLSP